MRVFVGVKVAVGGRGVKVNVALGARVQVGVNVEVGNSTEVGMGVRVKVRVTAAVSAGWVGVKVIVGRGVKVGLGDGVTVFPGGVALLVEVGRGVRVADTVKILVKVGETVPVVWVREAAIVCEAVGVPVNPMAVGEVWICVVLVTARVGVKAEPVLVACSGPLVGETATTFVFSGVGVIVYTGVSSSLITVAACCFGGSAVDVVRSTMICSTTFSSTGWMTISNGSFE